MWSQGDIKLTDTGSSLINESGSTFTLSAFNASVLGLGQFVNDGTANVQLAANNSLVNVRSRFNNNGLLNIVQGQLLSSGNFSNSGALSIQAGATLTKSLSNFVQTSGSSTVNGTLSMLPGLDVDIQAGTLNGNGLIIGNVTSNGQIGAGESIGSLTINGDYAQTGSLLVEIAGNIPNTEYDVLNISGQASLGGVVEIDLLNLNGGNPWLPTVDQTFDVLAASLILDNNLVLGGTYGHYFNYSIVSLASGDQTLRLNAIPVAIPPNFQFFAAALLGLVSITRRASLNT